MDGRVNVDWLQARRNGEMSAKTLAAPPRPEIPDMLAQRHALPLTALLTAILGIGSASLAEESAAPSARPFRMGFTQWPADLSITDFLTAQNFAYAHGDIVSVMFIGKNADIGRVGDDRDHRRQQKEAQEGQSPEG